MIDIVDGVSVISNSYTAQERAEAELFNAGFNLGLQRGKDTVMHALDHVLADIENERHAAADAVSDTREADPAEWVSGPLHMPRRPTFSHPS